MRIPDFAGMTVGKEAAQGLDGVSRQVKITGDIF